MSTIQLTKGHPFKLSKNRFNLELRRHYFTNRVVNLWKSLPSHVMCAPTVNSFKSRLDNYWNSIKYGQNQRPMHNLVIVIITHVHYNNNNNNDNSNDIFTSFDHLCIATAVLYYEYQ